MNDWRVIPEFPNYAVSPLGQVHRLTNTTNGKAGRALTGYQDKNGYHCVLLYNEQGRKLKKVHRLVVEAFIGEIPAEMQVNHKNGMKNDNRVDNLEIVTPSQNVQHTYDALGRKGVQTNPQRGERHHYSKLTNEDVLEIRRLYKQQNTTQKALAKQFNTRQNHISRIVRGESWKHLSNQ